MSFGESTLGKSIANVFERTAKKDSQRGYMSVALSMIKPPSANPRKHIDEEHLQELAESIRSHGILQPIVVTKTAGGYEIVAGERRYRAARIVGLEQVPVVVRSDYGEQEIAELRLIENIQREDLNPIEIAEAYRELMDDYGLTQEELAKRLGKSRSGIANSVRLLTLEGPIREALLRGTLSGGHAKILAGIEDMAFRLQLAEAIEESSLSVRDTERLAKAGRLDQPTKPTGKPSKSPNVKELEDNLSVYLGHRVEIKQRGKRGALTVHFEDNDSLNRLIQVLHDGLRQAQSK